jgi:hypothetical protein
LVVYKVEIREGRSFGTGGYQKGDWEVIDSIDREEFYEKYKVQPLNIGATFLLVNDDVRGNNDVWVDPHIVRKENELYFNEILGEEIDNYINNNRIKGIDNLL